MAKLHGSRVQTRGFWSFNIFIVMPGENHWPRALALGPG